MRGGLQNSLESPSLEGEEEAPADLDSGVEVTTSLSSTLVR